MGRRTTARPVTTPSTWAASTSGPIVRGERPPVVPGIVYRDDGTGLFYPGALHDLHGEPGTGKTWVVLFAVAETLRVGSSGAYLDYEGTAATFVERLRALDVADDVVADPLRVAYHQLFGRTNPAQVAGLVDQLTAMDATFVGLDAMLPALIRNGYDDNSNADLAAFYETFAARPLTSTGAALVCTDHMTKDTTTRARGARGAGAKLQLVDVSYSVKLTRAFSRDRAGSSSSPLPRTATAGSRSASTSPASTSTPKPAASSSPSRYAPPTTTPTGRSDPPSSWNASADARGTRRAQHPRRPLRHQRRRQRQDPRARTPGERGIRHPTQRRTRDPLPVPPSVPRRARTMNAVTWWNVVRTWWNHVVSWCGPFRDHHVTTPHDHPDRGAPHDSTRSRSRTCTARARRARRDPAAQGVHDGRAV